MPSAKWNEEIAGIIGLFIGPVVTYFILLLIFDIAVPGRKPYERLFLFGSAGMGYVVAIGLARFRNSRIR
jgi:hypothetical protein